MLLETIRLKYLGDLYTEVSEIDILQDKRKVRRKCIIDLSTVAYASESDNKEHLEVFLNSGDVVLIEHSYSDFAVKLFESQIEVEEDDDDEYEDNIVEVQPLKPVEIPPKKTFFQSLFKK